MSNRTISDEKEMEQRWDKLIIEMEKQNIDCLFMYSTDRTYSGYLRYVTDCPTVLYPLSGLFSKKGISLVGHGVKGVPLYPVPPEQMKKGLYQFHAGGVRQHDFVKDMIGVPACPTTNYVPEMWPEAIGELIRKYEYKRIGLVGKGIIPVAFTEYFTKHMPELELVDATELVDNLKSQKSEYEKKACKKCAELIDEILAAAPSFLKVGTNLREAGRNLRGLANSYDCMDLNIMLGKHPSMPMFSEWQFTDEEIIQPDDCIELMVEVSNETGVWGECARVFSMGEPPKRLVKMVKLAFEMQDYLASMAIPGAIPKEVFEKYCDRLEKIGFPREQRFCCHGQGFDVVEMPFIRPENSVPLKENQFIAIHPSMYNQIEKVGCFVCDNYMITGNGCIRMNKTPREIIRVYNTDRHQ